jgi:hypothetical protein
MEALLEKLNLTGISSSNEVLMCGINNNTNDYCPPDDDDCNSNCPD